eukprot:UN01440
MNMKNIYENRSLNPDHKTYISKADSNLKTVWVHRFFVDQTLLTNFKKQKENNNKRYSTSSLVPGLLKIKSELISLGPSIKEHRGLTKRIEWWTDLGYEAFAKQGLDPGKIMCHITQVLNFQDKTTRSTLSQAGTIMAQAFRDAAIVEYQPPQKQEDIYYPNMLSIMNIGSVRIDDFYYLVIYINMLHYVLYHLVVI